MKLLRVETNKVEEIRANGATRISEKITVVLDEPGNPEDILWLIKEMPQSRGPSWKLIERERSNTVDRRTWSFSMIQEREE